MILKIILKIYMIIILIFLKKINYIKNTGDNKIFKEFFENIKDYEKNDFLLIELYVINTKKSNNDFEESMIEILREHCKIGF